MLNLDLMTPFLPKNMFSALSSAMFSSAGGLPKGLPFDINSILETQRKNVQAMSEAQEIVLSGMQAIARQQSELMSGMIEAQSAFISLMVQEGTPEEKITRAGELTKAQYKTTLNDMRGVQDTMTETIRSAADILHKRTASSLGESQRHINKNMMIPVNSPANSDEESRQKATA